MRHLKCLREYIDRLTEIGEIQQVDLEVDPHLEVGAIIRRSYDLRAPAPLFQRVRGAPPGFRVLGAPAGLSRQPGRELSRVALSLGLAPTATPREIVDILASQGSRPPVPPKQVASGPCKENIQRGSDVDLSRFPVPHIHAGDGGRYINTWGTVIAQSPDGHWTNWCITRVMLLGASKMVGLVAPGQHLGYLLRKWRELGKDMPYALAIGGDPAIPFAAAMPLPKHVSEADFLGAYFGEPLELVAAESVPLLIPATAEIVIEGHISSTETAPEGPMGEYTGYMQHLEGVEQPVFHVSAVTHRHDPILPVVAAGYPVEEDHTCWGTVVAATVLADLRGAGFPVGTVFSPFESALHWLVITVDAAERPRFSREQLRKMLAEVIFRTKAGWVVPKLILVDDDIDPSRLDQVVWALATRSHPEHGRELYSGQPIVPLQAYLSTEEKKGGRSSKVIYDCLWPDGHQAPRSMTFESGWPEEIQARVLRRWREYGYSTSRP